ncbi:hypothetical protein Poli38472_000574 [Pythium oligandrum]|uniref:Uncharacterized protein n=1 Tax=Pythium oligandrum TaxID=41045 RepID=A0A8K1CC64_PYTOL|nr:hypothetical protein Poli38472_000574 [Pythium oligandrum]|eukprot:TMW60532.1 hypothetical protein Poli38472_000574 [Pythium oligandrum]
MQSPGENELLPIRTNDELDEEVLRDDGVPVEARVATMVSLFGSLSGLQNVATFHCVFLELLMSMQQDSLGSAQRFFAAHKDLFEYDKYVGGEITAMTPSFLTRYQECEQRHIDTPALQLSLLVPTVTLSEAVPRPPALLSLSPPNTFQLPSTSGLSLAPTMVPSASPAGPYSHVVAAHSPPASPIRSSTNPVDQPVSSEVYHQPPSPPRRFSPRRQLHQQASLGGLLDTPRALPVLADLLVDAAQRAKHVPSQRHVDDAKKIELLIGTSCVGRVSSTTNVPPAIRRRLDASTRVQQRREQLYKLLCSDYHRLTQL